MKANRILQMGLVTLVAIFLLSGIMLAGDLKNGGTINNKSGQFINVKTGNFVNYTTSAGTVNNGGTILVLAATKDFTNSNGVALHGTLVNTYSAVNGFLYIGHDLTNGGGSVSNAGTIRTYLDYQNQTGTTTNTGTILVSHDLTNGGGTFTSSAGTVQYDSTGASGNQSVLGTTYNVLNLHGGGTKTFAGDVTAHTVDLAVGVTAAAGATQVTFDGTVGPSPSGDITSTGVGTVSYTFAGAQNVFGGGATSYSNLTLSGAGTKTATGAISLSGNFTNAGVTTLQATNFAATGGGTTLTGNSGVVKATGTVSITGGTATTVGGTFDYNGTAGQAVAAAQYTNLTLSGTAGTVTFPASVYISGNYNPSGAATRNYAGSTLRFNGAATQTITGDVASFNNLEFYAAGEKQVSGTVTTTGTIAVNSSVTGIGLHVMAAATLTSGGDLTNDGNITNDGTITVN